MSTSRGAAFSVLLLLGAGCVATADEDVGADDDALVAEVEPELELAEGEGVPMATSESSVVDPLTGMIEESEATSLYDVPAAPDPGVDAVGLASLRRAKALARTKVWRSRVRCQSVTTSTRALAGRTAAIASWRFDPTHPTTFTSCHITYDDDWRSWSWGQLCTITVHEYGHLSGRRHSTNPRSVMAPAPRTFSGAAQRCRP